MQVGTPARHAVPFIVHYGTGGPSPDQPHQVRLIGGTPAAHAGALWPGHDQRA